jgi:general secretion pathway protein K
VNRSPIAGRARRSVRRITCRDACRDACRGARRNLRRGSALLAVLWLSLALSAIAFALSRTVRTEFDRTALNVESTRAYFLAQAGIEAAALRIGAQGRFENAFQPGMRFLRFGFPAGQVEVEIGGEDGKLSLRSASPEALARLFMACRIDPAQAAALAAQIVEARTGRNSGGLSTFQSSGASYRQLEELLLVPGMTPEILYGTYRDDRGGLVRVGGLRPHLTFEAGGSVNVNYASRQILQAAGLPDPMIETIEQIRRGRPLLLGDPGMEGLRTPGAVIQLGLGGRPTAYTLQATARLANGRTTRTVAAVVKIGASRQFPWEIVRWYGEAQ